MRTPENPGDSGSKVLSKDVNESSSRFGRSPQLTQNKFSRKLIASLLIVLLICAIFAIIMHVILPQEGQWGDMDSHRCDEYCENSDQCDHPMEERPAVQQPVNAYTNMAYIWCGIVPLLFLRIDLSTIMYFCASTLLAISSFMFHASVTKFWMEMDGANMYTYGAALVFHGLHVVFGVSWLLLTPLLVALLVAMPLVRPYITIDSELINSGQLILVVCLAAILVMARIYKIANHALAKQMEAQLSWLVTASTILFRSFQVVGMAFVPAIFSGVATIVWMKDVDKEWCDPSGWMQWHGVWVSARSVEPLCDLGKKDLLTCSYLSWISACFHSFCFIVALDVL